MAKTHRSTVKLRRRTGQRALICFLVLAMIGGLYLSSTRVRVVEALSVTTLGVPITQNFDTLPASGSATFINDSTIPGWYSARTGNGTTIVANDGSSNAGNLYSYGTGTNTDRALGSVGSGNAAVGNLFWGILLTNNTGSTITSLDVAYAGEQWRNSAAAAQTVAFSYITGGSLTGSLADFQAAGTNVTALDFTSPVTGGAAGALNGNLAANRTAKSFTIGGLSLANGQSILLRWSDPDHTGSDHGLSIDDFSVTPQGAGGGGTSLSVNDVSQAETNSGTTSFDFTVSLSSPAGAGGVTFNVDTADGTAQDDNPATEDNDYVAVNTTGSILQGNSSTTVTVQVNGDTTGEPNETFFVNISNISAGTTAGDVQGQGTIINDDAAAIHTIQGSGTSSPFTGSPVTTTGIVTLLKTTTNNGGAADHFFLQTPDADADADPLTSQGILVFTSTVPTVAVGDQVNVTGTVEEFFQMTRLTSVTNVSVVGTGNPLPTPVTLTTTILDPGAAFATQPQLERYEGMRLSAASLTTVAPNDTFFDVNTVITGVPRPLREPGIEVSLPVPPDPTSGFPDPNIPRWDQNPERIVIDTNGRAGASLNQHTTNVVLSNVVGPLDFTFGRYRLVTESNPQATANMSAVPLPAPLATEFTVANLNIIFFNNGTTQKTKVSLGIRNIMRYPDIIGHEEINNLTVLQALATQVNNDAVAAGDADPMYTAHFIPATAAGAQNVGFLVKTTRVQVISVTQEELPGCVNTTATCNTYINPVNGQPDVLNDRPPLVLRATVDPSGPNPIPVIAIVNHTRSFIDIDQDPGDGPRVRAKRKAQSEFLATLLDNLQDNNPGNSIISVGDYNAYQFNDGYTDPIATIKGIPTPDDQVVVDQSPDVVSPDFFNLIERVPATERYSFIFEGTPQAIDHILVNRNANARFTRIAIAHMNADFPAAFASDITRPERATDHDAPVAYFNLTLAPSAANGVVSGRLTDANGVPIAGAVVNLSGTQNRKFITDANGTYRFDGVETSGFYTVRPSRANYSFSPAERSFSQIGNSTEAAFTGSPVANSVNAIDTPEYFVRQHYLDFLGREPDESGFNFWSDQILSCGSDAACAERRTINVSAAYFLSIEFQQTGGLVDGLYRASYGRRPLYAEFMPDTATVARDVVVGPTDWARQLEMNKQAFVNAWVQRAEFLAAYDGLTNAGYVDTLIAHTGVNFNQGEREALVSGLTSGTSTRADVLRQIAENDRFATAKRNEVFVMMEYFGYLRRDPDASGFQFWLNKLNQFNGNFVQAEMVKAFLVSGEYRQRFR